MTPGISAEGNRLTLRLHGEILEVEPWGPDGVRVRAAKLRSLPDIPGALAETFDAPGASAVVNDGKGILTNGKVRAERWHDGTLHFFHARTGSLLLEEPEPIFNKPPARWYRSRGSDLSRIDVCFRATPGERIFGLGQHQHGLLDNKGCVIDLEQRNTDSFGFGGQNCVPCFARV